MLNLFYYYVTGRLTELHKVPENEYVRFQSPHQKDIDLQTYGFFHRVQYQQLGSMKALKTLVIEALFLSDDEKEFLVERFSLMQRCYRAFSRFARIYKVNRAKRFDIDCDLYTTPFSALPKSILTDVYDERTQIIYRFRLSDLVALTNRSLINAPDFFAEPLVARNPYTNIPFTKAQLYHIYFALKASPLVIPTLFHLWFDANFDLDVFMQRNECLLVDNSISDFIRNGSNEERCEQIYEMMGHYCSWLQVVDDYPDDLLLKCMLPYLHDYLLASHSLSPTMCKRADSRLRRRLALFRNRNPLFGRKMYSADYVRFVGARSD